MPDLTATPFNKLIADMQSAARLANCAANPAVRRAAIHLRDKAFAQFVWGE